MAVRRYMPVEILWMQVDTWCLVNIYPICWAVKGRQSFPRCSICKKRHDHGGRWKMCLTCFACSSTTSSGLYWIQAPLIHPKLSVLTDANMNQVLSGEGWGCLEAAILGLTMTVALTSGSPNLGLSPNLRASVSAVVKWATQHFHHKRWCENQVGRCVSTFGSGLIPIIVRIIITKHSDSTRYLVSFWKKRKDS